MHGDTLVRLLEYGVPGLCVVMLVLVWKTIRDEQKRSKPRTVIFTVCGVFMAFCLSLTGANIYLQLEESGKNQRRFNDRLHEMEAQHAKVAAEFRSELKERDSRLAEQSRELTVATRNLDTETRRATDAEADGRRLRTQLTALEASFERTNSDFTAQGKNLVETERRLESAALANRRSDATFERIRERLVAFATPETKRDASALMIDMAAALIAVGTEVASHQKASATDAMNMAAVEQTLQQAAKRPPPHFAEKIQPIGQIFVDELTGATVTVSELAHAGTRFMGSVSFPDGKTERIFVEEPGKSWSFEWNGRRFVIAVAHGDKKDSYKAIVRETTQTAASKL